MRKIIAGAIKNSIENFALIWLLAVVNVFASYFTYGFGFSRGVFFVALFSILLIYLLSVALQTLLVERADGNWPFGEIFRGGLINFPVMTCWIFIPMFLALAVVFTTRIFEGNYGVIGLPVFFIAAYTLGPAMVSLYEGNSFKKSLKTVRDLILQKTGAWILSGVFIAFLLILTGAASELLTSAAVSTGHRYRQITSAGYIFVGEFVRAASIVVILATSIGLYDEAGREGTIVEQT